MPQSHQGTGAAVGRTTNARVQLHASAQPAEALRNPEGCLFWGGWRRQDWELKRGEECRAAAPHALQLAGAERVPVRQRW